MPPSQTENIEAPINTDVQDSGTQPSNEAWDTMREQSKNMSRPPNGEADVQELEFSDPFAMEDQRQRDKPEQGPADPTQKAEEPKEDFLWGEHGDNPLAAITPDAIQQGNLGDCYFLAPLASLAQENPQAIKDMIKDNGDDTYTVTFPGDPDNPVTVERPTQEELDRFAHGGPNGAWVNVIEKAHRKYTGREESDPGNDPEVAIKLLTPCGTETVDDDLSGTIFRIGRTTTENVEKDITNALNDNRIIVVSTTDGNWLRDHLGGANQPGDLASPHAFTVVGYDEQSSTVKLRNPWGNGTGEGGTFEMSLDEFYNQFEHLEFQAA